MNRNIKSILWALTARGYDPYLKKNIFYYYCYSRPGTRTELLDPQDIEHVRNIIHQKNFNDIKFQRELNLFLLLQRNRYDTTLITTLQKTLAPYTLLKHKVKKLTR
jgi:hypothetical protein